jgi:hypothetical protein
MSPAGKTKPTQTSSPKNTQKTAPNGKMVDAVPSISQQERDQRIARAAYFRAQQRNFAPGGELEDWLQSESEVDRLLLGNQTTETSARNRESAATRKR